MKELTLTTGHIAIVDDDVFDTVNRWKWRSQTHPRTGKTYANRATRINGKPKTVLLHRQIMDAPDGLDVDHIDGNPLNCQRSNMRIVTRTQNHWNSRRFRNNSTGVKGVWRCGAKFRSAIRVNGTLVHLGVFATAEQAGMAYDEAARAHFGEFSRLNFPHANERGA